MNLLTDLSGRVALVTGASGGIGRAIAIALAEAGADIAANYHSQKDSALDLVADVVALGRRAIAIQCDVSQKFEVAEMIDSIGSTLGPVDVLINNAGVALRREIDDLTEADFDTTISVNLKSAYLCTHAVLPNMRSQKWGRIVNISSGAARGGGRIGLHYNASKAGLEGLTRGYASRVIKDGVTVNAVAPSLIETDMMPAGSVDAGARIPLGRMGQPQEVAQATLMVLGNEYMTGQTVHLNGGSSFN